MFKDLADTMAVEKAAAAAVASYGEFKTTETKVVDPLNEMIEEKPNFIGDVGVEIQQVKIDIEDTMEGLVEDKRFSADGDEGCEIKTRTFTEKVNCRMQELTALADTIRIPSADDDLERFKRNLSSASNIVRIQVSETVIKDQVDDENKTEYRGK